MSYRPSVLLSDQAEFGSSMSNVTPLYKKEFIAHYMGLQGEVTNPSGDIYKDSFRGNKASAFSSSPEFSTTSTQVGGNCKVHVSFT